MKKHCFKCGKRKPIEQFYPHRRMADGFLNKCKSCTKNDVSTRYASPEGRLRVRLYEKLRNQTEHRKQQKARYQAKRKATRPGVTAANQAVSDAVRDGRLKKMPCEKCGSNKVEAHHDDYRRKLTVRWLCFQHHREAHGQIVG